MKKLSLVLALSLILLPGLCGAMDFNAWIPHLPKKLGGMVAAGPPEGMNMSQGPGQSWSTVTQEYKSNDGKTASLSVIGGQMAPQVMGFQSMIGMNMNMDTGDQVMKTVSIAGKKAMVVVEKQQKSGTISIPVSQDTIVALTMEPVTSPNTMINLAKEVPLAKFAK